MKSKLNLTARIAITLLIMEIVTLMSLTPSRAVPPIEQQTIKNVLDNYANYPAPYAIKLLTNYARPQERDTLVTLVCFIVEDMIKNSQANGANLDTLRAALLSCSKDYTGKLYPNAAGRIHKWRFPVSILVEPQACLENDTSRTGLNTAFSIYDLRNLGERYGADLKGMQGYDEQGAWAHGQTGLVATGAFSSYASFEANIALGVSRAVVEKMNLSSDPEFRFRWWSCSNSSTTAKQKAILKKYGIDYGIVPPSLASTGSGSGERPSYIWPAQAGINCGLSTLVKGRYLATLPAAVPDRYEMQQCIAETSDTASVRQTIQKGLANPGSGIVVDLHNFALMSTNLAGNNAGDLSTVSGFCAYLAKLERQGRIRVVGATEFFENFYERPIGPGANWIPRNFSDNDADGNIDMWVQRNTVTAQGFPNGALDCPTNGTGALGTPTAGGYGGTKEVTLRHSGVSKVGDPGTGTANDPAGNARTQAWASGANAVVIHAPPKGKMAHVEFAVRGDTTKAVGHVTTLGDTVGVSWTEVALGNWNMRRQGVNGTMVFVRNLNSQWEPVQSWATTGTATAQPHIKLAGRDRVGGPDAKYGRGEFEFKVSEWCDILYITFWQGGRQESQSIRISDVFVGFRKSDDP